MSGFRNSFRFRLCHSVTFGLRRCRQQRNITTPLRAARRRANTPTTASQAVKKDAINMTSIDERLAKELNQLSFENRAEILEEIHCVKVPTAEETPDFIQSSICELQEEIAALPPNDRKAYEESLSNTLGNQYFLQQKVQLTFLRADRFNAKRAAVRLTKNAAILQKYFGLAALQRPLQFSDLGRKEQELLRLGHYQVLPTRDRAVGSGMGIYWKGAW